MSFERRSGWLLTESGWTSKRGSRHLRTVEAITKAVIPDAHNGLIHCSYSLVEKE